MVRSAQLVVPTITSSEITSKYIQLQYISEATHQERSKHTYHPHSKGV